MIKITSLEPKYMLAEANHADLPYPHKIEFIKKKINNNTYNDITDYRCMFPYNKKKLIKHCIEYSYFKMSMKKAKKMFSDEDEDVDLNTCYNSEMEDPVSDDE